MINLVMFSALTLCAFLLIMTTIWIKGDNAIQAPDKTLAIPENETFNLANALLLIGPVKNNEHCARQRIFLKKVLPLLLKADIRILEMYGDIAPKMNGKNLPWLDNQLLRKTLNAEDGFHLIYFDRQGRTNFQSASPVKAEALALLLPLIDKSRLSTRDASEATATPSQPALKVTSQSLPKPKLKKALPAIVPNDRRRHLRLVTYGGPERRNNLNPFADDMECPQGLYEKARGRSIRSSLKKNERFPLR